MLLANIRRVAIAAIASVILSWTLATPADEPAKPSLPGTATHQKLPFKQQPEADGNLMSRVIGGFVVVILLGYGAVYAIKRYFPSVIGQSATGQRKINVLETRRLTPKTTLFLVDVDGVRMLLGQSGDRIEKLRDLPTPTSEPEKTDNGSR